MKYTLQQILEYHTVFPKEKSIDIKKILKKYDRLTIVKACVVLDHSYGNCYFPDNKSPFFSYVSKRHRNEIEDVGIAILQHNNGQPAPFCTLRTILELLRITFGIPIEEFRRNGKEEDFEWDLFKIILQINERLMSYNIGNRELQLDELFFLSSYVLNDVTMSQLLPTFQTQALYADKLFDFLDNVSSAKYLGEEFKKYFGINDFKEYSRTILGLLTLYQELKDKEQKGCPMLDMDKLLNEGILSQSVIDKISMELNDSISYNHADDKENERDDNVDYRYFRSHPLIHISGHKYYIYSAQLLIERLYNSLFFDLKPFYKEGNFFRYYNTEFVEHYLFHQAMNLAIYRNQYDYVFPLENEIISQEYSNEKPGQPDFYIRQKGGYLFIMECKGIKLNGELKDKADLSLLIDEIKNKIYQVTIQKSSKKKKNNPIGIGQLVNVIDSIQNYECNFDNPDKISEEVLYYPIIIFEDPKIVCVGLTSMINRWYEKLMLEKGLTGGYKPIVVTSIDIIMKYGSYIKRLGIKKIIDNFLEANSTWDKLNSHRIISPMADFNIYMSSRFRVPHNISDEILSGILY